MALYKVVKPDGTVAFSDKGPADNEITHNALGLYVNKEELEAQQRAHAKAQNDANQRVTDAQNKTKAEQIKQAQDSCENDITEEDVKLDDLNKSVARADMTLKNAKQSLEYHSAILNNSVTAANDLKLTSQIGLGAIKVVATAGEGLGASLIGSAAGKLRELGENDPESLVKDVGGVVSQGETAAKGADFISDKAGAVGKALEPGLSTVGKGLDVAEAISPVDQLQNFDATQSIEGQIRQVSSMQNEINNWSQSAGERLAGTPDAKEMSQELQNVKEALQDVLTALDAFIKAKSSRDVKIIFRLGAMRATCVQDKTKWVGPFPR